MVVKAWTDKWVGVWIDKWGDVVWIDMNTDPRGICCLYDGCRLNKEDEDRGRINGLWIILK